MSRVSHEGIFLLLVLASCLLVGGRNSPVHGTSFNAFTHIFDSDVGAGTDQYFTVYNYGSSGLGSATDTNALRNHVVLDTWIHRMSVTFPVGMTAANEKCSFRLSVQGVEQADMEIVVGNGEDSSGCHWLIQGGDDLDLGGDSCTMFNSDGAFIPAGGQFTFMKTAESTNCASVRSTYIKISGVQRDLY